MFFYDNNKSARVYKCFSITEIHNFQNKGILMLKIKGFYC